MALEKQVVVDKIEVLENGCIQVREATRITEDGNVISSSYHRHVVTPADSVEGEDQRVKDIAAAVHTPEVKQAYQDLIDPVAAEKEEIVEETTAEPETQSALARIFGQ